jgi:hypothetical protein
MFFSQTTFLGIDPTAGIRPFTYAALDSDLKLIALGQANLDEVLAFVAGQRAAVVAVCAPRRPNLGLMGKSDIREGLSPVPRPGRWTNFRLAEYQLRQMNITAPQTPAHAADCPNWMRMGFTLYHRLENLNYQDYPDGDSPHQCLEVYPHASFTVLLDRIPLPKHSLEGRLQRQLVLHECRINLPDPMLIFEEITRYRLLQGFLPLENLYPAQELDALVAAYTAWLAGTKAGEVTLLGHPEEGTLVLPVAALKSRY